MKLGPARLAVLLVATVGLAVAVPPAQANTTRSASVFVGTFQLSGALRNPGPGAVPCLTGGSPLSCGNAVGFTFGSSVCVEANAPGKTAPVAGSCSISVSGVLTGFNGAATGAGSMSFVDSGGGWFFAPVAVTMVGDVLSLAAQTIEGAFGATVVLFPDPEPEPKQEDPPPPPPRQGNGLGSRSG